MPQCSLSREAEGQLDYALSKSCHCQNWLSISEPLNTVAVAGGILKFELNAGSIDVVVIFSPDDMLLK